MAKFQYNVARKSDHLYEMRAIQVRLEYLCQYLFGGNLTEFAKRVKTDRRVLRSVLCGITAARPRMLTQIIQAGIVNAEWLMCGSGPPFQEQPALVQGPLCLPDQLCSRHSVFDTSEALQLPARRLRYLRRLQQPMPQDIAEQLPLARAIHTARVHEKPVLLHLEHAVIADSGGKAVNALIEKGYVTGVSMSAAAASADAGVALANGLVDEKDSTTLFRMNDAAHMAAAHGVGYGEALGRWCCDNPVERLKSVIATGYALELPVTVHGGFGDVLHHFYPHQRNAELGAALGAAMYVDMLLLTEQLHATAGKPPGVIITTEDILPRVYENAAVTLQTADCTVTTNSFKISRPYWLTVPALLAACDAVYDGSADDGKRTNRL
jgi:hypothetical protein